LRQSVHIAPLERENDNFLAMGQQLNKIQKRKRRKSYLKRKKLAAKQASK